MECETWKPGGKPGEKLGNQPCKVGGCGLIYSVVRLALAVVQRSVSLVAAF